MTSELRAQPGEAQPDEAWVRDEGRRASESQGPPVVQPGRHRRENVPPVKRIADWMQKIMLGGQVANGPISYAVNGKQYVSVAAGNGLFTFALR